MTVHRSEFHSMWKDRLRHPSFWISLILLVARLLTLTEHLYFIFLYGWREKKEIKRRRRKSRQNGAIPHTLGNWCILKFNVFQWSHSNVAKILESSYPLRPRLCKLLSMDGHLRPLIVPLTSVKLHTTRPGFTHAEQLAESRYITVHRSTSSHKRKHSAP